MFYVWRLTRKGVGFVLATYWLENAIGRAKDHRRRDGEETFVTLKDYPACSEADFV